MAPPVFHLLSLCSGSAMLDAGVGAALSAHGIRSRVLGFSERESAAAACLLARMEDKALEPAPVWVGNLEDFPGERFHGLVDGIVAGFPCQPFSQAGLQNGREDERHLLPFILDIADASGADFLFLENVAGLKKEFDHIASLLLQRGWHLEWGTLRAADVGASHRRERWFCVAYRAGRGFGELRESSRRAGQPERRFPGILADGERPGLEGHGRHGHGGSESGRLAQEPPRSSAAGGDELLADSESLDRGIQLQPRGQNETGAESGGSGRRILADGSHTGAPEYEGAQREVWSEPGPHGEILPAFAPGPKDPGWAGILARFPGLAPALPVSPVALHAVAHGMVAGTEMASESTVRRLADGLAAILGPARADMLRITGNGVVWQCAAHAFTQLLARVLTK